MLRTLPPSGAYAIDALHKKECKEGEEQASNLQPQYAAGMSKRAQDGLAESLGSALSDSGFAGPRAPDWDCGPGRRAPSPAGVSGL